MAKNEVSREQLMKAAQMVRPAISNQSYIPALTHVRFDNGWATSYNDVSAIAVKSPVDLSLCLPGEHLIKVLGSFSAAEIMIEQLDDSAVLIKSGRSKLKVPTLPSKDFPFEWPDGDSSKVVIGDAILKGIERCLISVGSDPTHPAQMGVTLETDDDGNALLFSTDNFTISRFAAGSKDGKVKLPAGSPVILPTFFCEQLVHLAKTFADSTVTLHLLPGALIATFGNEAQLFTKTVVDMESVDFSRMINRYFKPANVPKMHQTIPDGFDSALSRAMLVLSGAADKATMFSVADDAILLRTSSDLGDADDRLKYEWDDHDAEQPFHVDPTMVVRALKVCSKITCLPKVMLLSNEDASFIHMISHCES